MPGLFEDFGFEPLTERHIKEPVKPKKTSIKLAEDIKIKSANLFAADEYETEEDKKIKEAKAAVDPLKLLKSKKLSLEDRLYIIKNNVLKVLGKQKNNILVIKDKESLHNYISDAVKFGRIAVDTETNNSLDPVTCKIMGLCLYVSGQKQVYVPINHRDPQTKERFFWQLTEEDIKEELERIVDAKTSVIMHNGKFDYEVLKCTSKVEIRPNWDTMVCARLLNENERAGLKEQYTTKIDKSQAKYHIDELFKNVAYADVDPDTFALYAATDSLMTDKLYELQKVELDKDEYGPHLDLLGTHTIKGLRWVFHEVEMPIVIITAEMELTGVAVDEEYGARLKLKYNNQLIDIDNQINKILAELKTTIIKWRLTPAANAQIRQYASKKSKMTTEKLEKAYNLVDENGNRYKLGKPCVELLEDPINLSSPVQLGLLFYDILGVNKTVDEQGEEIDDKSIGGDSRKTGKDELKAIKEKLANYLPKLEEIETEFDEEDLNEDNIEVEEAVELSQEREVNLKLGAAAKLADLLLKRRGIAKLLTTYIDVIPELVKHWPDHRIRFHLNALGTDTGRYSSGGKLKFMENDEQIEVSGINIQNIPSHNPEIRMLFKAAIKNHQVELTDNYYEVPETDEVETISGWKKVKELVVGDVIIGEDNQDIIKNIEKRQDIYYVYIN